jgi:hypothetical protein
MSSVAGIQLIVCDSTAGRLPGHSVTRTIVAQV